MSISAYNIGTKFNADGSVRFFPGNTIISKIDHNAPVFEEFKKIRQMLADKPVARCVTMLPDDSIHMTVIEGVCHQWRKPELWTSLLPIDCKLSEVDDFFEEKFKTIKPLGEVHMRMAHMAGKSGILIRLEPETEADAAELKRYRDEVGAAMGLHFPNHDSYFFHISICYYTKDPTPEEGQQLKDFVDEANAYIASKHISFTVQQPELTFFDNMFCFNPFRIPRNGL